MDERHQHAHRFRKVSNRYRRRVAERYDGDRAQAMTDTDDDVMAATVAAWKKAQGLKVTDWQAGYPDSKPDLGQGNSDGVPTRAAEP